MFSAIQYELSSATMLFFVNYFDLQQIKFLERDLLQTVFRSYSHQS